MSSRQPSKCAGAMAAIWAALQAAGKVARTSAQLGMGSARQREHPKHPREHYPFPLARAAGGQGSGGGHARVGGDSELVLSWGTGTLRQGPGGGDTSSALSGLTSASRHVAPDEPGHQGIPRAPALGPGAGQVAEPAQLAPLPGPLALQQLLQRVSAQQCLERAGRRGAGERCWARPEEPVAPGAVSRGTGQAPSHPGDVPDALLWQQEHQAAQLGQVRGAPVLRGPAGGGCK